MAELLGLNETYAGRRIPIPADGGIFGRDPRNHIVLTHESISSLHGIFRVERGALYARDQQSTNGTRLHGSDITEAQVQDGDELEIGNLLFRLVAPEFSRRPVPGIAAPASSVAPPPAAPEPAPMPALTPASAPSPASPAAGGNPGTGFLQRPSPAHTLAGAALILVVVVLALVAFSRMGP